VDPDSNRLRATVTDGRGRVVRDGGLSRWLASVAPRRLRGEVAIALVSNAQMRGLNRTYRRKDRPTDVLSFPVAGREPRTARRGQRAGTRDPRFIGDIVIARGVATRQAREAGHSVATELRVLALHGLLHLIGYDHDDPKDGGRMARAERRLLRKSGLKAGLIHRS
jgi:probable rRNA maturation factor